MATKHITGRILGNVQTDDMAQLRLQADSLKVFPSSLVTLTTNRKGDMKYTILVKKWRKYFQKATE